MAVLFGLATPLCLLLCLLDAPSAEAHQQQQVDSPAHPCHDSGAPPESDTHSESCADGCMNLELAADTAPAWLRATPLVTPLSQPQLAWLPAQRPARASMDWPHLEPPKGPDILLRKSTLLL